MTDTTNPRCQVEGCRRTGRRAQRRSQHTTGLGPMKYRMRHLVASGRITPTRVEWRSTQPLPPLLVQVLVARYAAVGRTVTAGVAS